MKALVRRHWRAIWIATFIVALVIIAAGLLVAAALSLRTYEHVKNPLHNAQNTLTELAHNPASLNTPAGRLGDEFMLAKAEEEISAAQKEIQGSEGLKILGLIPGLHSQRIGLVQLVADLRSTTFVAAKLLRSVNALAAQSHGTDISISGLRDFGATLTSARAQLAQEDRSTGGLWGPIGSDRAKFDREDSRAIHLLRQGQALTTYATSFLGANGPRTYLVLAENNAEMRDQGDALSYSLMSTKDGAISVANGGTVQTLELTSPAPGVVVPAGTESAFKELDPTELFQSANATADFPFTGRDAQGMFAAATGAHVDGVLGMDVVALQAILGLTGPVTAPGIPEPVSAQNASYVLLHQIYAGLSPSASETPRHEELAAVQTAAFQKLKTGRVDLVALARVLATEVAGRHLMLWDEDPRFEQIIRSVGASGAVDTVDPTRTFHVAVENATATKLDYFVDVAISDDVYISTDGTAAIDTAVTVTNHAPAGQPPSLQLGPDGINSHIPGEYVGRVLVWGPRGSSQQDSVPESGLLLNHEQDLTVLAGHSVTAYFATTIPHAVRNGRLELVFVPQPRLAPETLRVHLFTVQFRSPPIGHFAGTLSKTTLLTWAVPSSAG